MKVLSQGLRPVRGSGSPTLAQRFGLLEAVAVWAVLAAAASWALAQGQLPGTPALIAMTVETDRSDYLPGEPVVLTCHLVNWQSPLLMLQGSFGLQSEATDVRIYRNGEMSDTYRGSSRVSPMSPDRITMPYAKTFEYRVVACYDSKRRSTMALDTPGEYWFTVHQNFLISDRYRDWPAEHGVQIEARTEPVSVVEASDASAAALKLLRSNPHSFEDLGRQSATGATAWIFRKIVSDYPLTRYTPYCLLALAHQSLALGGTLPEEAEKGQAYLRQIIDTKEFAAFPLRLDAQALLADALLGAGRPNASRKMVEDLIQESPDNLTRLRMHACAAPFLGPSPNPYTRTDQECWFLFDTTQLVDAYEQRNPGAGGEEKKDDEKTASGH